MQRKTFLLTMSGLLCLILSACQHSPQKNYYLLSATAPASQQKNPGANITTLIGIGPIEIADYLNRTAMVYTQADNSLVVSDNDYWGENLTKGIARVLADNLTQRNNTRSFVEFPWRSDSKPTYSLRVNIRSLERNASSTSINATWELVDNTSKVVTQRHHFARELPAAAGANGLAQGYSKLLADLASEMDTALNSLP